MTEIALLKKPIKKYFNFLIERFNPSSEYGFWKIFKHKNETPKINKFWSNCIIIKFSPKIKL